MSGFIRLDKVSKLWVERAFSQKRVNRLFVFSVSSGGQNSPAILLKLLEREIFLQKTGDCSWGGI